MAVPPIIVPPAVGRMALIPHGGIPLIQLHQSLLWMHDCLLHFLDAPVPEILLDVALLVPGITERQPGGGIACTLEHCPLFGCSTTMWLHCVVPLLPLVILVCQLP